MITFRGSRAGACTRELVLAHVRPETTKAPKDREDFLRMGHLYQTLVEEVVRSEGVELLGTEGEGVHNFGDFDIVGHVDGVIRLAESDPLALLEVKAVRHHNFQKLRAASDWREVYGNYVPQAQTYVAFDKVVSGAKEFVGPFEAVYFWFIDRDTSEHLSGIPSVKRPNHSYRADMRLLPSAGDFNDIVARHREAYVHIQNGTVPEYCDKAWGLHCYFCGRGFPRRDPRQGN